MINMALAKLRLRGLIKNFLCIQSKPVAINTAFALDENIYSEIISSGCAIGHLKFLLDDNEGWIRKISFTNSGEQKFLKNIKNATMLIY
jgi:hypothetical protein